MTTGAILDQLVSLAGSGMGSDEHPVAAARVNYNGAATTRTATLAAEMAMREAQIAPDGSVTSGEIDPATLIEFPAANQMALLVTDKRVVVWGLSFTGKPAKLIGVVPAAGIASVHTGEVRFGSLVRVVMKSGTAVDLEVKKGDDAEGIAAALEALSSPDGTAP